VVPRKAIFVKDKYFVEIAAEAQGDHSALLREAAKALVLCVPGDAAVPKPVGWFPAEGLTAGPPRLVPESVLGIRILKRGYVAQYGSMKAFVVSESSAVAASATMAKLRARFAETQPAKLGDEALVVDDKYLGRICIARRGPRLIGYANVPPAGDAVSLTAALLGRVPE
jgi:cob(I)alamin adenosyltransferase